MSRPLRTSRALTLTLVAAGAAAVIVGCGSISVVSDGGNNSGTGGNIDIITGSGGTVAGTGGTLAGTGGTSGQGGAIAGTGGARTGTGGTMTGSGGSEGTGGAGSGAVGGALGTGGRPVDAGVDVGGVDAGMVCTAVRGCCSTDDDCNANQECAGMTCNADGRASGVCKARPARNGNRCWTDADCAGQNNNNTCTGAVVCPCGAICVRPDALGMCN